MNIRNGIMEKRTFSVSINSNTVKKRKIQKPNYSANSSYQNTYNDFGKANFFVKREEVDFKEKKSFEAAIIALINVLENSTKNALPEKSMSCCVECNGSGDLLCCDSCMLAFHINCLRPKDCYNTLYTPTRKHGFKNFDEDMFNQKDNNELDIADWFCPYCLSDDIMRIWKRGVPNFLKRFAGFGKAYKYLSNAKSRYEEGSPAAWCREIASFMVNITKYDALPQNILLALCGIRSTMQKLETKYKAEYNSAMKNSEQLSIINKLLDQNFSSDENLKTKVGDRVHISVFSLYQY